MSEMQHFPSVSYVSSGISVNVSFDRLEKNLERTQYWLGNQVLVDCKPVMPFRTGTFIRLSYVTDGGAKVVFPGPTGRFLYGGKVMVDPVTRSPFARPGVKKELTDRPLKYSNTDATDHWFETAKARNLEAWIAGANRIMAGGA